MSRPFSIVSRVARGASSLHALAGPRVAGGNTVQLLIDGREAFPAMLEAIARAERTIWLESYIFGSDATGARFLDALTARARAGVAVRVMVDGVGSIATELSFFAPLVAAGGKVVHFEPPHLWRTLVRWWRRNHRKVLILDDVTAFIGGLNISDDYAPEDWGGGAWHDVHARVDGPAARELTKLFNREWRKATGEPWPPVAAVSRRGEVTVQILESRLTQRYSVRRAYLRAIKSAAHTVRICNAYCIPDQGFRRALKNAAQRGVRVQMLFAGTTDVKAVRYASRHLYARLMRWGVEVYEWNDRVLHAKSAVIDGSWCTLGSYNIDTRSLRHNFEANIACVDPALGAQMDREFEEDLARSARIDPRSWHRRPAFDKLLELLFFSLRYVL